MSIITKLQALEFSILAAILPCRSRFTWTAAHQGPRRSPSGASTGKRESVELRDGDSKRFGGKGVRKAVGTYWMKYRKLSSIRRRRAVGTR